MSELLFLLVAIPAAVASAGHALLFKRHPRASIGWIAICIALPIGGPLLYFLFGLNRIRTRAKVLVDLDERPLAAVRPTHRVESVADKSHAIQEIVRVSNEVTENALLTGNRVELLVDGITTYPQMLSAIDEAQETVYLSTYIFSNDDVGRQFVTALAAAVERGVLVRVLVDGIGEWYSRPRIGNELERHRIPFARFLPPQLMPPRLQINLRNHRKILLVDGQVGFTGGINLGQRHLTVVDGLPRVRDLHFELAGPVLRQLERIFCEDWLFAAGERLHHQPTPPAAGEMLCRGVADGPNRDIDRLVMILLGSIAAARHSISIVTPYFIPSRELIAALQAAALRGLEVRIVLPQTNNLRLVHWATRNYLWELLERGVRVFYQAGTFVHSKLYLVDHEYVQIGSANIDPRSLRLNFEIAVEVIDSDFATAISRQIERYLVGAHEITLAEVESRPLPVRVRDALAWLASPYL